MTTARKRSTIAATLGVLLIALVQWAATEPDLAQLLGLLLPAPFGRLALVLLGGAATVLAVYRASVHTGASEPADTLEQPAPAPVPTPAAMSPQGVTLTPTAGVGAPILAPPAPMGNAAAPEPEPATSLVQLVPVPARSFL